MDGTSLFNKLNFIMMLSIIWNCGQCWYAEVCWVLYNSCFVFWDANCRFEWKVLVLINKLNVTI